MPGDEKSVTLLLNESIICSEDPSHTFGMTLLMVTIKPSSRQLIDKRNEVETPGRLGWGVSNVDAKSW